MNDLQISYALNDAIPKEKSWTKNFSISQNFDGNDVTQGVRLYTDGSKLDDNSGYGAVLMKGDDICNEICGSIGTQATVFQAESYAILHGLDILDDDIDEITILTDNQA